MSEDLSVVPTTEPAERPARARRGARAAERPSAPAMQPVTTAFDLLAGTYAVTRNTRIAGYLLIAAIVAAVVTAGGLSVPGILQARSSAAGLSALEQQKATTERTMQQRF